MNRRDLLKGLFGASAAAVVPLPLLLHEPDDPRTIVATTQAKPAVLDTCTGRGTMLSARFLITPRHRAAEARPVRCRILRENGNIISQFDVFPGHFTQWEPELGCEPIASPDNSIHLEWNDTPCDVRAESLVRIGDGDLVMIGSDSSGNSWREHVHSPNL